MRILLFFRFGKEKNMSESVDKIKSDVRAFVETSFPYEVFDITYKPVQGRMVLEVTIDTPDGVTVQDCEKVSRGLSDFLDEVDLIHRAFTLEVSSPGVERVFKRQVDYERHVGKMVRWTLLDEATGRKEAFKARLQEFSPDRIVVRSEKGLREFPLTLVKEARAVLEFPPKMQRG
ncbi:MAG TPA: ribosome maturation factor RimP [Candidatus Riflebacteria bacterium]|jgi:ribosome maturation factor RimP|nr:ribosome maturation factor RimP [Candidatus Riflebacteria bacterium]